MKGNDLIGIIFSDTGKENLSQLTCNRTMGAIPFGGKYKLIDFPLSNMSNSGITRVGVVVKDNYKTLMNHLGSGKSWNLSRVTDGLFIIPPNINGSGVNENKIDILFSIQNFISESKEKYVFLCNCDIISNINYKDILKSHIDREADVTITYCKKNKLFNIDKNRPETTTFLHLDNDYKIKDMLISSIYNNNYDSDLCVYTDMMIFNKLKLLEIINDCASRGYKNFERDVLQSNVKNLNMYGYEVRSMIYKLSSIQDYFKCNMSILDEKNKNDLFNAYSPIYTKTYNNVPAKYGKYANISNSLISNGCKIDGKVCNSIIFEGVHIDKNSYIKNSVIMSNVHIGYNCEISYCIIDEEIKVNMGRKFMGFESYPVYIGGKKNI